MKKIDVKITFTEGILGTSPNDEEIYANFIASKAPDASTIEDEIAAVGSDEVIEKGTTVFPRTEDGIPFMYDYQVKGFFKDACGMLARVKTTKSSKIKAYKKVIDGLIFVGPRQIPIQTSDEITICQRPLRAQTAQGERVALASSEEIAAGATMVFTITTLQDDLVETIREWLNYGQLRGLGQWRNSGKGKFIAEIMSVTED